LALIGRRGGRATVWGEDGIAIVFCIMESALLAAGDYFIGAIADYGRSWLVESISTSWIAGPGPQ
jgi:hypothetical protein